MKYRYEVCTIFLLLLLVSACATKTASGPSRPLPKSAESSIVMRPTPTPTLNPNAPLRQLAQARGILIGSAVGVDQLQNDPNYGRMLATQFSIVTPENAMKFAELHPAPNLYTFAGGDAIVAFAKAHGMQVRGHNLVWYRDLPSWVANGYFTRAQLMSVLQNHITTVVSHYRGQLSSWDVVNEAINDGSPTLRDSLWMRVIGPDYIDLAFRWAHAADPQVHLFYNDYGGEGLGMKSDAIYNLVKGMVQRGVPIYGVGLQMHVSITDAPSEQDVIANMQRLAALGLKVQITEMDVQIQNDPRPLAARLAAQAQVYHDMLSACLAVKACEAFVMWGFTDRYTWIPAATGHPDSPLIFDENYRPKPAYTALVNAFLQA
jgi:endo-1,4-beta-xylanase